MRISRTSKALALAVAGLALGAPAAALAEPVQQFSFQVKDIKPGGRFTLIFNARTFDTTGAPPPSPIQNYLRIPAGATLRREFRSRRYFCDGPRLRTAIDIYDFRPGSFNARVANLKPLIRQFARSRDPAERRQLANAQACDRGRIGGGTARIDARESFPTIDQLIRATFSTFLSRPTEPGAVAGFTVLGAADEDQEIVRRRSFEVITGVHAALNANFFNDPTGPYGYRLDLPRGEVNGFKVSIAELNATTKGLTILRGTCLKQNRRGRCVRRQRRTIFWFTTPPCPANNLFSIEQFYGYSDPALNDTQTIQLACPRFVQ
ncbi:MAG TPA: hypothetical protein VK506_16445 [Conexibacter sp.]|nr:hypothetical protein [Conexibacter sp.]